MIAGSSFFFQWFIWHMLCLCHYGPALLRFWFQTDLRRKNSASFFKIQAGKTFSYHGDALVTLYIQFLCSGWSKFDGWVHAENLCNIFKVSLAAEADRVLCQLVMFLTTSFSTGCTKWNAADIKSLLLFMADLFIGFLVRNAFLSVKIRMAPFSFFTLLNA